MIPALWTAVAILFPLSELCGKKSNFRGDWREGSFDIAETKIEYREGSSYPEGGSAITYTLDICPTCFHTKLGPWFQQQGGKIREVESDW